MIALLSYPWLIERYTRIGSQFYVWNLLYGIYLILLLGALFGFRIQPKTKPDKISSPAWKTKGYWIFLSFLPCSLMLSVTFYITTDVAATPLLWVMPLALYLLSFVFTFAKNPPISHQWVGRNALFFLIFPILGFIFGNASVAVWELLLFHLANFFMLSLFYHGELARTRPNPRSLTTFYFCLSFGGLLAGVFNGLIAPNIFLCTRQFFIRLFSVTDVQAEMA